MRRFDRRRRGRHASDRMAGPRQAVEPPIAGSAADGPQGRSSTEAKLPVAHAAETAISPADLLAASFDEPYAGAQDTCFPAPLVRRITSGEVVAAIAGYDQLARALRRQGLQAEMSGYPMDVWPQPGGLNLDGPYVTVVLGNHPNDPGRLWWWRIFAGAMGPEGQSDQALLMAIGRIDEIALVAHHIARVLHEQAQSGCSGEGPAWPADGWGLR